MAKFIKPKVGQVVISPEKNWHRSDSSVVQNKDLIERLKNYVDMGLKIYVGSDSMLYHSCCVYSSIIAVHSNEQRIASYFYQKERMTGLRHKNLDFKIFKEIQLSIDTANFIKQNIPSAEIEIHIDIGDKDRNATRHLVPSASGWVKGMGFDIRIKPDSWASSVADWHTK